MEKNELIFNEYKLYVEQKENFINRNFLTNRFYMIMFIMVIFALIYTSNIIFIEKISATLIFSLIGLNICILWWMNIDSYNTLIKIKYSDVIEKIEENFPVKPVLDEFKGIQEYKKKKIFMFSDIQKIITIIGAIFFFAIMLSELSPIIMNCVSKIWNTLAPAKGGI